MLLKHPNIWIVSDDIYEHIIWNDEGFVHLLDVCPELKSRTVVVNGVSKAYAMTGWRIGYSAAPAELTKQMKKIQSQSTSNPCSIAQAAAVAALDGDQSCIAPMLEAFKRRHDLIVAGLNNIDGITCQAGDGTFYAFPNIEGYMAKLDLTTDVECAEWLLENAGVAVVPGSAFGSPGHARLSFATSDEQISLALERITAAN